MYGNLGVSALIGGAQTAVQMIPTAADRYNKERLRDLEAGGLTAERQAAVDQVGRETFEPARALAHESRLRSEATAAMGEGTSAATATRAGREERGDVQRAAMTAGLTKGRAKVDAMKDQFEEFQSRIAEKGQRQIQKLGAVATGLSQVGALAGQVQAAQATKGLDLNLIAQTNPQWSPSDLIEYIKEYEKAGPLKRKQLEQAAGGIPIGLESARGKGAVSPEKAERQSGRAERQADRATAPEAAAQPNYTASTFATALRAAGYSTADIAKMVAEYEAGSDQKRLKLERQIPPAGR